MIPRLIAPVVASRLKQFPAVALVGPRQCGKTTLARSLGGEYFDLEQQPERLRLDLQWDALIAGNALIVLDEAQSWPEVFNRLRGAIDERRRRMGRFLLLGSVSPALMSHVAESLAGRLSVVEIAPFSYDELPTQAARNRHWLCGGYPDGGVLAPRKYPRWELDYLTLLSQRDLPNWGLAARPQVTDRLLRMLAAMHGQLWNASQIGQSLGLSYHTINGYLEYLIGAFLIRRLSPYHNNIGKRLTKSPKLYWRDSGLVHALLGISDSKKLLDQPWVGASWEGYVIEQVIRGIEQRDRTFQAYFYHVSGVHEIDLVLDFGHEIWAIEVKLTAAPTPQNIQRLDQAADEIRAKRRFLVSQTNEIVEGKKTVSCNLPWLLTNIRERLL